MPEIAVSAEDLVRLAEELDEVRAFLAALDRVSTIEPWAFGPGETPGALLAVLGNWQRYRLLLGRQLDALALAARAAGAGYAEVEATVTKGFEGLRR
ncbi:hypothetical protein P0Y31_09165 [Knoellia sp. 3-2P3]|uniref:hypothetical protein n=1 Tax=unclassified Knoellia TaxID=2618719 RepID=UPI0023DA9198|nr:hypothetical protein [Knoellia sp. 3-2P3]MDF2092513.1 hypothetical protein [Knoellia sp. 3-2P3]